MQLRDFAGAMHATLRNAGVEPAAIGRLCPVCGGAADDDDPTGIGCWAELRAHQAGEDGWDAEWSYLTGDQG